METLKVETNNRGIENSGITNDFNTAICEFIWNSFDAHASIVDITYIKNELEYIDSFTITDNGDGINREEIQSTFGNFLDSQKKETFQRKSDVHGRKGKGRFSFIAFANDAEWTTKYVSKEDKCVYEYKINVDGSSKNVYQRSNKILSDNLRIGTNVRFFNLKDNIRAINFERREFIEYVAEEFGWFLVLNSEYEIRINGEAIDYRYLIADERCEDIKFDSSDIEFNITYIRWAKKIGDKFYYYYLKSNKQELSKELSSFNNNGIDFIHSMYIKSSYFDNFIFEENPMPRLDGKKNQKDSEFIKLKKWCKEYLSTKQKEYVRIVADSLIDTYERSDIFPSFKQNKYDNERKADLTQVVKELYCAQPKIFIGLNKEQQKTYIGLLNLILDSDERDNVLSIISSVVTLSPEERNIFKKILDRTSLRKIIKTIDIIKDRYTVVESLKMLVYDLTKYTTERGQIQTIIESNYWLFGEQFNLVTADKALEQCLTSYLYLLDGVDKCEPLDSKYKDKRPDIFMCRTHKTNDAYDDDSSLLDENIIIELKRPSVSIGIDQYRQIENYLIEFKKEPKFNSQKRIWKFYVVSTKVDDYIKGLYESCKDKNKRFLVHSVNDYEIFAMTWDDVFKTFELRYDYLLAKLDFDKTDLLKDIGITDSLQSQEIVDILQERK